MKLIFDKDSNGTQELVDALGLIDARTDFSKWKPYIPLSIRRLTAIIGQEVYDKVLDFYQSASVDPDGKLTRLLGMVQQSVALFTWLKIIPTLDAQHGNTGRQKRLGEHEKGLTALQEYKDEANILSQAYESVDALIAYLEQEKFDFWIQSPKRKAVSELLLKEKGNRNRVSGVVVDRCGRKQRIRAKITIDATGTGLIGELAGAPAMYGRDGRSAFNEPIGVELPEERVQSCTWQFITQALVPGALLPWEKLRWKGMVEDNHGWLREPDVARAGGLYLHWGGRFECKDTRDPVELAKTQAEALESLRNDFTEYHKAGYKVFLAPKIGVREVRRIKGEYVLAVDHLRQGLFPDDTIAISNYGIDAWGEHIKKEDARVKSYGIPYRCLLPLGVDGLLIAGRSISGSHLAMSSYRVQPIVASIGQAAGTAAAMAVTDNTDVRGIDVDLLVSKLRTAGLFDVKKLKK